MFRNLIPLGYFSTFDMHKVEGLMKKEKMGMEDGRTVSESIGALGLFGVVVIGGVMGYGHAIKKSQEADALDQISVLIAGGRTWDIPLHFGDKTIGVSDDYRPYIVPIRDVVSVAKYRSKTNAFEAGLIDGDGNLVDATMKDVREYESFDTVLDTPVWVRAEDEQNWSVRITGLSYSLCEKLLRKSDLGFDYAYVAYQNSYDKTPTDPDFSDFSRGYKEDKYANPSKNLPNGISTEEQIVKVCSALDVTKGDVSLAQTYIQHIDDNEKTGVASGTKQGVCKDRKSVACLAYGARIYNPETNRIDLPLQTLVLHFGDDVVNIPVPSLAPDPVFSSDTERTPERKRVRMLLRSPKLD